MFGKEELNTKVFPVTRGYGDITFDEEKVREYYEPEVLRVNTYAYIRAERYINDVQKSLIYWKRRKSVKNDVNNLPDDFFPTVDWFDGSQGDLKEYATKMNINPDLPETRDFVYDVTTLLNWDNEEYSEMKEEYCENDFKLIKDLHNLFVNKIVSNNEDRVKDLIDFYRKCISGESDILLHYGTNFDRIVKEREEYITDDEDDELVDVSPEEVRAKVQEILRVDNVLTDGDTAPEIDSLDDEIFSKANLVPVRDEKGRLVKGQKVVKRPKQVYSKKYPKVACDTCFAANRCPEYKSGYACAYNKMFERFDTRNMSDIVSAMQGMVNYNLGRMQRAMIMENLNGTVGDPIVTAMINQNTSLLNNLKKMYENSASEVLKQSRVVRSDGSTEEVLQVTNPQSGGILEKLFSSPSNNADENNVVEEPIRVKGSVYDNIPEE